MKRFGRTAAIACLMCVLSATALAQGKVAVLNLEEAVFSTEEAKAQFNILRQTPDYTKNKKDAEALKKSPQLEGFRARGHVTRSAPPSPP